MSDMDVIQKEILSPEDTARILKEWWKRDRVVSSTQHNPQLNAEFLQVDDVNNSINRLFDDIRLLREGSELDRMHRHMVKAPLVRHPEEDLYQGMSKESHAVLHTLYEAALEKELIKTAAAVMAADPDVIRELAEHGGI